MAFNSQHLDTFARDGCAVVNDFLSAPEVHELRARIHELLLEFEPSEHPTVTFPTSADSQVISDQYFFDSSTKASYFLEQHAVSNGKLTVDACKAVNKIGHGVHIVEPLFKELTHSDRVKHIAELLGFQDPRVLQSMVICKQPGIGGAVPMHQDSTFLFTDPPSACGFWIALEDCTLDNGCLHFVPGSHRTTPITRRMVRSSTGEADTEFIDIKPVFSLYPLTGSLEHKEEQNTKSVQVKAGSLVLIHGQVLHLSSHNHSQKSRWIYTFHIVEGSHAYDQRNWLQMPNNTPLTTL
ncbi:hypothetical protein IWW56_001624 [Coemansia sp. RSA 2131]|nr:hypothetical protein IWW56_001624 [Coemansia sp. RSA 2131]